VIKQTQVSPEQLVAKKMASAEQALRQNDVQLAEQYLADVLLLQPTHIDARKQLAALWFGRKAYQEAINTLSQGIALAPHNSELRLLQSRIYLQQGYTELALQALSALTVDEVTNIEYLATLANIAQQLQRWPLALNGYQRLTQLQPTQANWWLGLAIAQDSEGQFQQAIESYNNALFQGNLSPDAKQFIQQRLAEIGE
jgi:MSHA biogenesis protein MshN